MGQREGRGARAGGQGTRGGTQERGITHCSSSRPRHPHSPQTGCSDWSFQCRCRPGSGIHPRRRPSLEEHPPRAIRRGPPLGGPGRPRPGLPAQSACPAPSYSALNQTPWGLGTKDQQGCGGVGGVGGAGLGAVRGPARVALTVAGNLIRTVPTVVCSVAPQHVGHTAPIVALAESLLAAACICRAGSRPQSAAATGQGLPLMRRPEFAPLTNLRLCNRPAWGSTPSPVGVAGGGFCSSHSHAPPC